jgi:hypothetical protein
MMAPMGQLGCGVGLAEFARQRVPDSLEATATIIENDDNWVGSGHGVLALYPSPKVG